MGKIKILKKKHFYRSKHQNCINIEKMKFTQASLAPMVLCPPVSSFLIHNNNNNAMHALRYYQSPLDRVIDEFFSIPFEVDYYPTNSLFKDDKVLKLSRHLTEFEITEEKNVLKVMIDVPGVKAKNLDIEIKEEGNVISIKGKRVMKRENVEYESKFERIFNLGKILNADDITANLSDGVLTVTVPKFPENRNNIRKIKVSESKKEIQHHRNPEEELEVKKSLDDGDLVIKKMNNWF